VDKLQVRGNNLIAIMIFGITVAVIFGLKRANVRYPRKVLLILAFFVGLHLNSYAFIRPSHSSI
jgi:hypothetical protein